MPRWTKDELRAYEIRRSQSRGPHTVQLQESQDGSSRQPADRKTEVRPPAKVEEKNEGPRGRFRVRVDIGVSTDHRRDADGMLSGIMDCFVNARRRLLAGSARDQCDGVSSVRAGDNNDD